MTKRNFLGFILLLMPIFYLRNNHIIVDRYYSKFLYKKLSFLKNIVFDLTDFAVGEAIYFFFLLSFFLFIVKIFFVGRGFSFVYIITSFLIIIYFFYLSWGINYFRLPLYLGEINKNENVEKKIESLTRFFSYRCNDLKTKIKSTKNSNKTDYLSSYKNLINTKSKKFKYSNLSLILSYMGIKGYFNPFTNEAIVNYQIPKILIPITIYHELAHKEGYALESDANFIGFLNAFNNNNIEIQYSASFFAFRYLYRELYKINPTRAKDLYKLLTNEVKSDILNVKEFWKAHTNRLQKISVNIFDLFLKTQGQDKGIKSYNVVVKHLLFAFDGEENFIIDGINQ